MPAHYSGIFHIHRRKRASQKLSRFPHKNPWLRFLDKLLILIAVLGPFFHIPQIIKIYTEKNASGVSFLTWSLFIMISIPWLIYGLAHKEKPIIISYFLLIIMNSIVVAGIILYG